MVIAIHSRSSQMGESGKTRTVIADMNGEVRLTVRLTTNEDGERVLALGL